MDKKKTNVHIRDHMKVDMITLDQISKETREEGKDREDGQRKFGDHPQLRQGKGTSKETE